jgi:predicted nucleic acid-binding protein
MWIVDSSVWIDYFSGRETPQTTLLHASLGRRELGIGDLVLCEVLQGFNRPRDFEVARRLLLSFPVYTIGGAGIAVKAAVHFRQLRRHGITVRKTVDCLIATFVIESKFALLHNDRDFAPFEHYLGLAVVR